MEWTVSASDVMRRMSAALSSEDAGPGGKHILVACAPKSGSTYLATALSNLPGFLKVDLTLGYDNREQELCLLHCAAIHSADYAAQHHVRLSPQTASLIRAFHIFPVVLTRNLFDTVVSLRDHMIDNPRPSSMAFIDEGYLRWSEGRQLDFIIDFFLPWYANFLACWSSYQEPCVRVLYRDFVAAPAETVARIAAAAGVACSAAEIDAAVAAVEPDQMRLNVGRVGRGREVLSNSQIRRIDDLFEPYAHLPMVRAVLTGA